MEINQVARQFEDGARASLTALSNLNLCSRRRSGLLYSGKLSSPGCTGSIAAARSSKNLRRCATC